MKSIVLTICLCAACFGNAAQYSKLGIITAAKQAGKWDALKAWIDEQGLKDEWLACAYLSDAHPAFASATNAVVASGLATTEELSTLLAYATDTAPDALLARVYAQDMKNTSGRQRWHGSCSNIFEVVTNGTMKTISRKEFYEDGYIHIEPGKPRPILTPEEVAKRPSSKVSLDDRIAALRKELESLQSIKADEARSEVDRARAVLNIASITRKIERLEASRTNTVNVVVSPEIPEAN